MSEFQSALESVIGTLEQMRDGGGRLPRASRSALEMFARPSAPAAEFVIAAPALATKPLAKAER
ncbi:MAG TPA: hypothetical protein VK993_08415, partial [Chthoniobacterales bacterium]|nr:hypothetical protein [Chthoniobacterales bacterium]